MASNSGWLALGAFACVAGCLAAAAAPAIIGGGLAGLGWRTFGWEAGVAILSGAVGVATWLYLRGRKRRAAACGCGQQSADGAGSSP